MENCNIYALVVQWIPEISVRFFVRTKKNRRRQIADNEPLKEYENNPARFSLSEHIGLLFQYIEENFDGEQEAELILEVPDDILEEVKSIALSSLQNNQNRSIAIQCIATRIYEESEDSHCVTEQPVSSSAYKIAVIGKLKSGKTELIQACVSAKEIIRSEQYREYRSESGETWYELPGIDISENNMISVWNVLDKLLADGLTHVVYCFFSMAGKMEDIERIFLHDFRKAHPEIRVCAAVTMSVNLDSAEELAQVIHHSLLSMPAFVTLAREYNSKAGYVAPFGIDELTNWLGGSDASAG